MPTFPVVESGYNSYHDNVQGKANEPICVAGLLDRARRVLGIEVRADLGEVYDRLDANAPRIAIVGGSPDHPAHPRDGLRNRAQGRGPHLGEGRRAVLVFHPGRV